MLDLYACRSCGFLCREDELSDKNQGVCDMCICSACSKVLENRFYVFCRSCEKEMPPPAIRTMTTMDLEDFLKKHHLAFAKASKVIEQNLTLNMGRNELIYARALHGLKKLLKGIQHGRS